MDGNCHIGVLDNSVRSSPKPEARGPVGKGVKGKPGERPSTNAAEIGLVGNEGVVGVPAILGGVAPYGAIVQNGRKRTSCSGAENL